MQSFDFNVIRTKGIADRLATELARPGPGHTLSEQTAHEAATAYIDLALRDGFTVGRGALTVARLASGHGIGFMRDAQNPQLAALFRADIQSDEPWRLALLQQWVDWHGAGLVEAAPSATITRLRHLAGLIRQHGAGVLAQDPAWICSAIDAAKTARHHDGHWHRVAEHWRGYFGQAFAGAAQFQIDYACCIAFCCGQYFTHDPLWRHLSDLRTERLLHLLE